MTLQSISCGPAAMLASPTRPRARGVAIMVTSLALAAGCASGPPRPVLTDEQLQERAVASAAESSETFRIATRRLVDLAWSKYQANPASPPTLNFLAMSGGGDYGAFGAGFLVGWGQCPDPASRRPDFDIVTGVSTGALLAPFAFAGDEENYLSVENFYRNPDPEWIKPRGLLYFLPANPSFMVIPKLEASLEEAMSPALVNRMAEQSRRGKVLAISATDLDFGRQHFWNLGLEAEAAAASGNSERVRKILLASAAIPVAFPPVEIDGSLYADGGVTANVFVRLEPRAHGSFIATWREVHPDAPLPRIRYWVIVNNSLSQPPATVQAKWPSVLGPSLATAIRSATISEVRWLAAQADYVNASLNADIEVRVVAIPDDWRAPAKGDFNKETMNSLADLGRKLGADPGSWKVWSVPPGSAK